MTSEGDPEDVFRTFCHISEYAEDGYVKLHRMVATSSPIVLWSPSSVLIASKHCRLKPSEFVRLVENKTIRIIGRENWIMSRTFRDHHRWPGAQWMPEIDDALKSIATDDELLPISERRVALAEKERGDKWAEEHLDNNSELVDRIYSAISAPNASDHFPKGVIETALSSGSGPRAVVERIVRDAYNHDAAIAQSGTRTPFLLAPKEARFHQLLESVRAASDIEFAHGSGRVNFDPVELSDLTREVLHVLQHLEGAGVTKVSRFVASEGHILLANWMKRVCDSLDRTDAHSIRGEVISRLREDFDAGVLRDSWRDIFLAHESLVGSFGTGAGIIEGIVDEISVYGALGLATGAYAIGHGLAQKLGFASVEYDGPKWAFIYAFGRRPSGRRTARLQLTLDTLVSDY